MRKKDDYANFQNRIFHQISELQEEQNRMILEKASKEGLSFDDITEMFTPGMDGRTLAEKIENARKK
jgi:hypothetical protein